MNSSEELIPIHSEDNSQTFFNKRFNEAYHGHVGPINESLHKFVLPSCLEHLLVQNSPVKILDLFFGLGYNTGICINQAYKISQNPKLQITGVEFDMGIINKIPEIKVPKWYQKWQNILSELKRADHICFEDIEIKLILKDVFEVIDELPKNLFDIIFFDPFSHKSAPQFWTEEFLNKVFKLLNLDGTLTTYSSLKRVENLAIDLGYAVKRIEPLGRKKSSLLIKRIV